MFEIMKQSFLVHQAFGEGEVAFLVLRGDAALGIDFAVDDVEAPRRRQLALALISVKHRVEDVEHRHVLKMRLSRQRPRNEVHGSTVKL